MNTLQDLVQSLLHDTEQLLQKTTLKQRSKVLIHAARDNDIDLATKLLPHSDATLDNCDALEWAIYKQNLHMVQLLTPHSDLKNPDNRCLRLAFNMNNENITDLLYPLADVNTTLQKMIENFGEDHEILDDLKRRMKADEERAALNDEVGNKGNNNIKRKM